MQNIDDLDKAIDEVREYGRKFTKVRMIRYGFDLQVNANEVFSTYVALGVFAGILFLRWILVETGVLLRGGPEFLVLAILLPLAAYHLAWRLNPKNAGYNNELCEDLANYDPVDKDEYLLLQNRLKDNVGFHRHALKKWIDAEHTAIAKANRALGDEAKNLLSKQV